MASSVPKLAMLSIISCNWALVIEYPSAVFIVSILLSSDEYHSFITKFPSLPSLITRSFPVPPFNISSPFYLISSFQSR